MVIGNLERWAREGRTTQDLGEFVFVELADVTASFILRHAPEIILSPLVGDDFDVLDVARRLHSAGFAGRYRAIAPEVPNVNIIRKEVTAVAPDLDFDVLVMPESEAND